MQFTCSHASPVQRNPSDSLCECLERLLSSLDQWRLHRPFSITAPSGMPDFIKHFPSRSIRPRLQEKYISFPNNLSSSSKINKLTLATEHLSCLGKYSSDQYKIFHLVTASRFLSNSFIQNPKRELGNRYYPNPIDPLPWNYIRYSDFLSDMLNDTQD